MPNLTVAEALSRLVAAELEYGGIPPEYDRSVQWENVRLARLALLAAHDAEAVAGDWECWSDGEVWWVDNRQTSDEFSVPDEATARLYANFLNKADRIRGSVV